MVERCSVAAAAALACFVGVGATVAALKIVVVCHSNPLNYVNR